MNVLNVCFELTTAQKHVNSTQHSKARQYPVDVKSTVQHGTAQHGTSTARHKVLQLVQSRGHQNVVPVSSTTQQFLLACFLLRGTHCRPLVESSLLQSAKEMSDKVRPGARLYGVEMASRDVSRDALTQNRCGFR